MAESVTAIILAAGQGTRMKSQKPKVLHTAAGRPLLDYVLTNLKAADVESFRLVIGHGGDQVRAHVETSFNGKMGFFFQAEQRGTADAVKSAEPQSLTGTVIICNGDHPLISAKDYRAALMEFDDSGCDLLVVSCEVRNPFGFGRIVRSQKGKVTGIVEEKDASLEDRLIREVNSGLYVVKGAILKDLLPKIKNNNAKKEFYITDLVSLGLSQGLKVEVCRLARHVVRGVNTQTELALAARALYRRKALELMEDGVVFIDPTSSYIDTDVRIGMGTTIHPGVMISGQTIIGKDCLVEAQCSIKDSTIADGVEIRWGSLIEKSRVGKKSLIGPYARLRPESLIGEEVHIGNFVETKKATIGNRSKANHLTYLGDVEVGEDTNIGCGTITCNYATDRKKYKTKIGNGVFVGSDTQFIAPVTIGDGAVIGSGSTITKDVPPRALAVARGKQFIKPDYNRES